VISISAISCYGDLSRARFWPRNDYVIVVQPTTNGIERTLTFYRSDDSGSNNVPNYQEFPSNELAAITKAYPPAAVKWEGGQYIAKGEFAGALPNDVGGAGSCTNFVTSLGSAGFYMERFRGSDDLAAKTESEFHAADQITDLLIGWTRSQWGKEHGYKKLQKFLDTDFRQDLKNASLYFATARLSDLSNTNAPEEFSARFGQYLLERGYVNLSDAPQLYASLANNGDGSVLLSLFQRLILEKMGVPASQKLPQSFAILNDPNALGKSWDDYLSKTKLYRDKVKIWETKRKSDPSLQRPKPDDVIDDLDSDLLYSFKFLGDENDHLIVKLDLPSAPVHTNGKWQNGQVIWETALDPSAPVPVFCYANWSTPNVTFQKNHFGRVVLSGDNLTEYCLWQNSLSDPRSRQWETFLAELKPDDTIQDKIHAFQFTTNTVSLATTNASPQLIAGCQLLINGLTNSMTTTASPAPP
jgi:hypothetical protein